MRYLTLAPDPGTSGAERIGVLLINSGTPEAPEPRAVRAFLARFLSDPRVVELPRALWLPLLWGVILPFRPLRVARKYRNIWSNSGSPLRDLSVRLGSQLDSMLAQRVLAPLTVEVGMLYSAPDLPHALRKLYTSGARRILVVPLFPQYCGATTGAAFDQVSAELRRWRALPELHFVSDYHDHPGYIEALRASITEHWDKHGRRGHLLMSFHGIPEHYVKNGDPYYAQCQTTARLLADELMLRESEWIVGFQSRFGPKDWLRPYTSAVLKAMPGRGIRDVNVVCPGFAVDCLETLEEIAIENREIFMRAGGERYDYIPSLNARADHARFMSELITQQGWTGERSTLLAKATDSTSP
ncbi:MAG: ferrochelatase [Proteobacteria bacterium]|nr:ferrochelatase [Pseudomonadota bacterium]